MVKKGVKRVRLSLFYVVLLGAVATVAAAELYLRQGSVSQGTTQSNYRRLADAHRPFSVKYAHPAYGFFFVPSDKIPAKHGDGVVDISRLGFRGPGPDEADGRSLAFLVGNSVVFGFAPHDSLTITGFLNRIQDEYFFVNAGAPSWVSRQMHDRVVQELLPYRPALIVFWGGYNDASVAFRAARSGQRFEAGRIEQPTHPESWLRRFLGQIVPRITDRLERALLRVSATPDQSVDPAVASLAADAFVDHVLDAQRASAAAGVAFLAVYQPILHHHDHRPPDSVEEEQRVFFDRFRSEVLFRLEADSLRMLDLGNLFDSRFEEVPLFTHGVGPDLHDQVFVDRVHLYVPGNEVVAGAIYNGAVARSSRLRWSQ